MGYNYVVFGAGKVGKAVVYDLLCNCKAERIVVIDPSDGALQDIDDWDSTIEAYHGISHEALMEYDVAISCATYSMNPDLCRQCVEAGIPFLDLGGNPDSFEEIRQYCKCHDVKTPVITDCGLSPGICNMFAAYLAGRYGLDDIEIVCGGIPQVKPDNKVLHISAFSPEGLKSEYLGLCPRIVDGHIDFVCAQTAMATAYNSQYETFPTSNNSLFTAEYLHSLGVKNYSYRTLRWMGHNLAMWGRSPDEIPFEDHEDKVIIDIKGQRLGRLHGFHTVSLPVDGFTAMARTTAMGITSVAHYVAKGGSVRTGFQTPEQLWSKHELMNRLFEALQINE